MIYMYVYICENHVQTTNNKYFGQMITFHPGTGHDNLTVFRLSWVLSHFQTAVYFWSPKGENVTSRNQLINVDGFFVASDWNSNWGILKFSFLNSFSRCTRWFFVVKGNRLWHEWTWFFRWIPTKIWKFLFLKFQARGCHENSPTCFHEKNHPTETPLVTWKGPDSNKDFSDLQPELVFGLFLQLVNCPFSQAELIWLCQSSKQILLTTAATEITIRGRMEDRKMKKLFFLVSRSHPAVHTQDVSRQDVLCKQSCFRFPKSFKQTYCPQLFYREWVLQYHHTYRISNAGIFGG